jgi:hypothetical protein
MALRFLSKRSMASRLHIMGAIAQNRSNRLIARDDHHSRTLIRRVRRQMSDPEALLTATGKTGRPPKVTEELIAEVERLTCMDRRMGSARIARILTESSDFPGVSRQTVDLIRRRFLGFRFLPASSSFPLTETQIASRIRFAAYHLGNGTDWSRTVFSDESFFVMDSSRRWLWRRRGEDCSAVYHLAQKYPTKVMVFGGIARDYKSALIVVESGTVNAERYIDELLDQSGIIPDMNQKYGSRGWTFMQDGASCHTAASSIAYLNDMVNLLAEWPSGSPDLNPIENMWAVLKHRVEELRPGTKEELITLVIATWDAADISLVNNLVDSVPRRLQEVVQRQGNRTHY